MQRRFKRLGAGLSVAPLLISTGCAALFSRPSPTTIEDRLSHFPRHSLRLKEPATVRWSENLVPFIEAGSEEDAAYLFGLTHAFLRLGQMEILRRVAQGRLSESAGVFTVDLDRALRIFQFGYAAKEILKQMPPQTRLWVSRYTQGINDYIARSRDYIPEDLKAADITPSEWTEEDLVGVWRVAATDVNWMIQLSVLLSADKPWSEAVHRAFQSLGMTSAPSFGEFEAQSFRHLFQATETGSNSIVVDGRKSASGFPIIASDPHLGITIPNIWVIVALSYPGSRAVGLSIPGVPFIALGRSENAIWGGTNMWGLSTAVHSLTHEEAASASETTETIRVRGWFDSSVRIRRTRWGPILSDAPQFEGKTKGPVAVRWMGHEPSDEITGFLNISRSKSFSEFRDGFHDYAVSAQNLLFADRTGNIGHLLAYRQPLSPKAAFGKVLTPTSETWTAYRRPTELPFALNPKSGFIASANNVPAKIDPPIGSYFQSSDRFLRLSELASSSTKIDVAKLKEWQIDTYSASAQRLLRKVLAYLPQSSDKALADARKLVDSWDGRYEASSRAAVFAEFFLVALGRNLFALEFKDPEAATRLLRNSGWKRLAEKLLDERDKAEVSRIASESFEAAVPEASRFESWGDARRMRAAHPFTNIPLIGGRWQFDEFPASGGSDTLHKATGGARLEKSYVDFGSNARHISDLGHLDENYFCLLGGQDGWLTSPATLDQAVLWQKKEWMRIPLSADGVKAFFPRVVELKAL